MPLPSAQDYNEAIQAPNLCFIDPTLKSGRVRTNALGLPVAVSGGFASVYQLTLASGETWAIRCFIREVQDQQRRYGAISRTLESLKLPYTVPFQYQQNGIRVAGATCPIVKMRWLRGEQLGEYVQNHLNEPARLTSLARKWVTMVETLGRHKIAHCDLQHGNVLVVNDELQLIDYDGMFVPDLRGMRSNEIGHPNYQHPKRSETDFDTYNDNFSAWVIYASLRILAIDPSMLALVRSLGRDECLLFNKEDFINSAASPFLSSVKYSSDPTVTKLSEQIEKISRLAPRDVPQLDASLVPDDGPVITVVSGPSDWWKSPGATKPANGRDEASQEPSRLHFSNHPRAQVETFLFVCGSFMAYFVLSDPMGPAGYLVAQLTILLALQRRLRTFYQGCPETMQREGLMQQVATKDDELEAQTARRVALEAKLSELQARVSVLLEEFQKERATLTPKQGAEMKEAHTAAAIARSDYEKRRRVLEEEEQRTLAATISNRQQQVQLVEAELRGLDVRRDKALRTALDSHQRSMLDNFLRRHDIRSASIAGIGSGFKNKLFAHGITTAADVEMWRVQQIRGFGAARTSTIVAWRETLTQHYSGRIASSLPATESHRLEVEFAQKRMELVGKIKSTQQAVQSVRSDVAFQFAYRRTALGREEMGIADIAKQKLEAINVRYTSQFNQLQQNLEQAKRSIEREIGTHQLAHKNLEADIRHLNQWFKDIEPRIRQFDKINFNEFVWFVFLSYFNLQNLRK